jgi:signal transduction histidine kinase
LSTLVKRIESDASRLVLNHRLGLFAILLLYSTVPAIGYLVSWGNRSWAIVAVIITYSLGAAYLNYVVHSLFAKRELCHAPQDPEHERLTESKRLDSVLRHDLMNSVNVVMGFADLLSAEATGPLNQKQQRYVHIIRVTNRQILDLVNSKSDRTTQGKSSQSSESPQEIPQQ